MMKINFANIIIWLLLSFGIVMASAKSRHLADVYDSPAGFISIDCGAKEGYKDEQTGIYYTPDEPYINSGISFNVSNADRSNEPLQQLINLRSFPDGIRSCYTLNPNEGRGTNYLVRAYFMYGNYDLLDKPPTFDLHLGVDVWDTIKLDNSSQIVLKEMIHTPSTDYLYVCLVNTGSGTPFISGLELRHLNDSMYTRESGSFHVLFRGYSSSSLIKNIRYPFDMFDRFWPPMRLDIDSFVSTKADVSSALDFFNLPSAVMKTAVVPADHRHFINYLFVSNDPNTEFYIYLHVAELQNLTDGQIREFNVSVNGLHWSGPYVPLYLKSDTIYSTKPTIGSQLNLLILSTTRANLPPILNALEIFKVQKLSLILTTPEEDDALKYIKSFYNLTKNWQGDPCNPKVYAWDGVGCSQENSSFVNIISLNLSSSRLTGEIATAIANLSSLQILDLSNNNLSGQIPNFLTELLELKTLNLTGNSFTGSIPELLLEKSKDGSLLLSTGNNPGLCSGTCNLKYKKKTSFAPIAAGIIIFVILVAIFLSVLVYVRRRKLKAIETQGNTSIQESDYIKKNGGLSRFTYSEVKDMTGGFQTKLGEGGFGVVYHGSLRHGVQVAVKKLKPSINASEQFSTEIALLMDVRHKNLVSLIGYCKDGTNLALVYEYMARGNLESFLSDATSDSLSWKTRLLIAVDAAQGLDYLHNGCRPPIVHRDVKTPNILLNQNLQAKIADFGYSKIFPDEQKSHVSTRVIGTPGYVDPAYQASEQLNEKSDVYSFGIVLFELITGQGAVVSTEDRIALVQWIMPKIQIGDIWNIVDQRLQQLQNSNSVWRAIDLAMSCVKQTPAERPVMGHIVAELKDCLAMETEDVNSRREIDRSIEITPMIPSSAVGPDAR